MMDDSQYLLHGLWRVFADQPEVDQLPRLVPNPVAVRVPAADVLRLDVAVDQAQPVDLLQAL